MPTDPVSERRSYSGHSLDLPDLDRDPLVQLRAWLDHAGQTRQAIEPSAMVLSTVDHEGRPSSRTVLLRRINNGRLYFFTNYASRKGRHLADNPNVALLFRWTEPLRQVEVLGTAVKASEEESDAYFASRPRNSQISAHASPQSSPISDRNVLDARFGATARAFDGLEVPRPRDWGGYVVSPRVVEFWQGRPDRLHDRFVYQWRDGGWTITRLAP